MSLGQEAHRGQLPHRHIVQFFVENILQVIKVLVEIVREIVPEEFLKEKVLHSGKKVDAARLAVESLELSIVTPLYLSFIHRRCSLLNLVLI